MKPDYKNWVPKGLLYGLFLGTIVALAAFILLGATDLVLKETARLVAGIIFGLGSLILLVSSIWMTLLYRLCDYNGKRKISKDIVEGTAAYLTIPEGGTGLDVGCGSGALTIACAKRNPKATMVGCDTWQGSYGMEYSKKRCEDNAVAEGVTNVRFEQGSAVQLPFPDESFDAVTSNYVYHNIARHDKQKLLLETLRVLKKGGVFAIHDLMSKSNYGDMDAFIKKLTADGYEKVQLIGTADGSFVGKKEAKWFGLASSRLLTGKK